MNSGKKTGKKEGGMEREEEQGGRERKRERKKMSKQLKNLAQQFVLYVFNSDPTSGVLDDFNGRFE